MFNVLDEEQQDLLLVEPGQFIQSKFRGEIFFVYKSIYGVWLEVRRLPDGEELIIESTQLLWNYTLVEDPRTGLHASIVEAYNHA